MSVVPLLALALLIGCQGPKRPSDTVDDTDPPPVAWRAPSPDVNGDGWSDLVVTAPNVDHQAGRVYVYEGGPEGPPATPSWSIGGAVVGQQLGLWLEVAPDMDGDGGTELVVGDATGTSIYARDQVLLYREGSAQTVVVRGRSGLLLASASGSVTDLLGNEVATFADGSWGVRAADLDEDGFDELFWAESTWDLDVGLFVLPGPLDDAQPVRSVGSLTFYGAMLAGDVDGDGTIELVAQDGSGFHVVRDPLGSATMTHVSSSSWPSFTAPFALADLDRDGLLEAASGSTGAAEVTVFELSTREMITHLPGGEGGAYGKALAATDIDGDGGDDLIVTGPAFEGQSYVDVWSGRDLGEIVAGPQRWISPDPVGAFAAPSLAGVGDVDGDGTIELAVVDGREGAVWSGRTSGAPDALLPKGDSYAIGEWLVGGGDLDGDGLPDVMIGSWSGPLAFYFGSPDGLVRQPLEDSVGGPVLAFVGDLDGDGYDDAAASSLNTTDGWCFELWYGGESVSGGHVDGFSCDGPVAGGDLDGDGYAELVLVRVDAQDIVVYPGGASGPGADFVRYRDLPAASVVLPGDLDGDGGPDIVTVSSASAAAFTVSVLHYPGTAVAASFDVPRTGSGDPWLAPAGDADGDGLPDLLIGGEDCVAGSDVYLSRGSDFSRPVLVPRPPGALGVCQPVSGGDLDGDGADEIVVQALFATSATFVDVWVIPGGPDLAARPPTRLLPYGTLGAGFGTAAR